MRTKEIIYGLLIILVFLISVSIVNKDISTYDMTHGKDSLVFEKDDLKHCCVYADASGKERNCDVFKDIGCGVCYNICGD